MSNLAVRAGLVPPPTGGDELEMPPPARSMRHARSLSASTMASIHSRGASSSSLASRSSCTVANSTSTCSTTLTSSTTSTTPSGSSLETLLLPTPAWTFDADQLPPLPARCHPPNPNANLRFVYEQGASRSLLLALETLSCARPADEKSDSQVTARTRMLRVNRPLRARERDAPPPPSLLPSSPHRDGPFKAHTPSIGPSAGCRASTRSASATSSSSSPTHRSRVRARPRRRAAAEPRARRARRPHRDEDGRR